MITTRVRTLLFEDGDTMPGPLASSANTAANLIPSRKEQILAMLRNCYDPEIPFNIVDLGLIYSIELKEDEVKIKMTLTSPGCPVGPWLTDEVKEACLGVEGTKQVFVEIVFNPPWSPAMMSESAHKALGF